jgi:DNA-binding Lrp family transcriptional regulator
MLATVRPTGRKVLPILPPVGPDTGSFFRIDAIDKKILAVLQVEGRLTVTDLAARVGLSVSPCHRRVRELEATGVIQGYRAVIDPAAVDLGLEVVVLVTMRLEDSDTVAEFERLVAEIPNVIQAERLFGDPDFLLRVACADVADYQRLQDAHLARLPGIGRFNSTLVMRHIVRNRPLVI